MPITPEAQARITIDALLQAAGWHVCNLADANIHAALGVAIREFPLNAGFGFADYLLYVNGKACGVIEAKKEGATLIGMGLVSGRWQADMFPARTELPKTLFFAKDDNHAEKIVEILREEFGRDNEFAQKNPRRMPVGELKTGSKVLETVISVGQTVFYFESGKGLRCSWKQTFNF